LLFVSAHWVDNYPHEAIFLPAGHIFLDMKYQTCLTAALYS